MDREIEILFHELADLSGAERERYFEERHIRTELRAAVEQLLLFDGEAESVLTGCVAASAERTLNAGIRSAEGRRYGAYRLLRLAGHGGMGSVYLAERADGEVEQQVAVKVLRYGGGEAAFLERFLRERQILATLNHPGIARLLDAGHSGDGQPYLVMEYIDGEPIDAYCAALDIRQKLELFLRVCAAVSYAHSRLILHRDIKPSNILVDRDGEPKLLDFGIAKLLDSPADQTGTRDRLLTPEYASPEQIRGAAQLVTSDIYSLGAVLYKLLTGRSPHAQRAGSREGIEFAICSTEPAPPSSVQPAVPRDLDFIIGKALRKEPEERYGSADALADDIRAFLESRPLRARRGDAWYRARKFVARYRMAVAAAGLVIASLSAGLYVADRERALAQQRFSYVRQLSNKLFDIDAQVRDIPGSTKTRQLIVDTALEYLRKLAADVRGDSALALEVGNAYMRVARVQGVPISPTLGQADEAEKNLRIAEGLIEPVLKAQPANRTAMLRLAQITHDRMILTRGKDGNREALALAQRSAEWLDKFHAAASDKPEASAILNTYLNVAGQLNSGQKFADALRLCNRGADLARAFNLPPQAGAFLWVSAQIYQQRGNLDEALKDINESVRLLDPGSAWMTRAGQAHNFQLAMVCEGKILGSSESVSLGRTRDAIEVLEHAFRMADEFVHRDANDHNSAGILATAAIPLGDILRTSDASRALEIYDHALGHITRMTGDVHLRHYEVTLLAGSTYALRRLKRMDEASRRLDAAMTRLKELKIDPAEKIYPGSEAEEVIQALADCEADSGNLSGGVGQYQQLLAHVQPAKAGLEQSLEDAVHLSNIYESAAPVFRQGGQEDLAAATEDRRRELWRAWDRKLPGNPFVQGQLAHARVESAR